MTFSIMSLDVECCYAQCNDLFIIIMLNVFMLSVVMLNVFMLNLILLNVIMLSVGMLSVAAPNDLKKILRQFRQYPLVSFNARQQQRFR